MQSAQLAWNNTHTPLHHPHPQCNNGTRPGGIRLKRYTESTSQILKAPVMFKALSQPLLSLTGLLCLPD